MDFHSGLDSDHNLIDSCYDYNKWSLFCENQTKIYIPLNTLTNTNPSKAPVFFNPAAKFNRDISIQIYKTFTLQKKNVTFVDSMAGSGIRGLRVAKEVPNIQKIIFNDVNPFSSLVTKANAVLNEVFHQCRFYNLEICDFLSSTFNYENRPAIIDLDPYGTPAPYLDCMLRSVQNKGIISVTATDTAVLNGVYPKVCFRKYYGRPLRTRYSVEVGIRILLSCISLIASRIDIFVMPLFVHAYRNYLRVYCRIVKSSSLANDVQKKLGFILHCFGCGHRYQSNGNSLDIVCPFCETKMVIGGPLWISNIFDKVLLRDVINSLSFSTNNVKLPPKDILKMKYFFEIAHHEIDDMPFYFTNDEIGRSLKRNVIEIHQIVEELQSTGYKASQTLFDSTGFKTNAAFNEIKNIFR
ncbi:MAG: tRNA (guanine(10)-N(2))-dimethyltransferase [Thermoproteota archaeon]|nr:tRNA (guanine(10)-N(2))-dimethyltransferase [Thermoproteota archaeon]